MITENIKALISYRLEQSQESLDAAKLLYENGLFRASINRSYHAMFYSILALLASKQTKTSKHSGAISLFDKDYVKTGFFTKSFHGGFMRHLTSDSAWTTHQDILHPLKRQRQCSRMQWLL